MKWNDRQDMGGYGPLPRVYTIVDLESENPGSDDDGCIYQVEM